MTIEEFSKQLIEKSLLDLAEKTGTCNSSAAGTLCPRHGDADCNSSKQNRKEELMSGELIGTTYEAVLETGETIILEKEKGLDGKACWKGYKQMGTKKKGGKTVDNCVKSEEVEKKESEKDEGGKHKEYKHAPGKEEKGEKKTEKEMKKEAKDYLPGSQEKLDTNKNGKLDADDFKKLRAKKGKTVKEMWQVAEGKKVEIEIMPIVNTPNDMDPPTGRKTTDDIKKKPAKKKATNEQVELEEKKLSAKETAKKEKVVKGMKKKFGKMKSKYGDKAQSVMYGAATNMAKKSA